MRHHTLFLFQHLLCLEHLVIIYKLSLCCVSILFSATAKSLYCSFSAFPEIEKGEEKNMEGDGVAYMVMGEGGEAGQATQVVAVDNGDGTQQLVSTRVMWFARI